MNVPLSTAAEGLAEDDLQEVIRPIASLISKSGKALLKLKAGTWQHRMLEGNLRALHIALGVLGGAPAGVSAPAQEELQAARAALAAMAERGAKAQAKFAPGMSLYSLQRNRIRALRTAEALIAAALSA